MALSIGNTSYPDNEAPLSEPIGNARRMAQTLRQVGFDTTIEENLTKRQMQAALDAFAAKIEPGTIAFLFFSGIGLQAGGRTYLVPVDAVIWSEQDVKINAFSLDRIIAGLQAKGAKVRIVVIDGARRNPFERRFRTSGSMGLAPIKGADDTLALYSNVPGAVLEEGGAATSAFVEELVKEIEAPGATAEDAFRRTRLGVSHLSQSSQRPWISSSLSEDFVLNGDDCRKMARHPGGQGAPRVVSRVAPVAPANVPAPKRPDADGASASSDTPPERDAASAVAMPQDEGPKASDPVLTDPTLLAELHDRLFEQNFDPGSVGSPAMDLAIRTFEKQAGLPEAGAPTDGLLQKLREAEPLRPWGAIIFATGVNRWGMSWGRSLRRQALDEAKSRCGSDQCTRELSFYGKRCGAFALSSRSWIITWRNGSDLARKAALADCARGGQACRLIGAVCADGSDRTD